MNLSGVKNHLAVSARPWKSFLHQHSGLPLASDSGWEPEDSSAWKKRKNWVLQPGNWEPFSLGDLNKDRKPDTAFVYTPAYWEEKDSSYSMFGSCLNDSCYNLIRFSTHYPEIQVGMALWSTVEAIQDLNGDGIREIIVQKNWWIGSHVTIQVYSFFKGKWKILAQDHLYMQDSYKDRVRRIDNHHFWFMDEVMEEGDYLSKRRRVTFGKYFDGR